MIVMMGFFAFYCGFIYNDFIGVSLNIFGSCFDPSQYNPPNSLPPINDRCVYPFGLDPIWGITTN
jgi:V-type H+-transporting ATPase subunit a